MKLNLRVSLGFIELPDAPFDEFASNVAAKLTGNAAFPTPPVLPVDITTARQAFHSALIDAAQGGKQLTAIKDQKRVILEEILRKDATYVQGLASQDLAMLLSSGYEAASTNRTRTPLPKPLILSVTNGLTGQLLVRVKAMANCRAWELQKLVGGNYVTVGIFTDSRRMVVPDLTPGTVQETRVRGVGGSANYSDWSDPVSRMVT